MNSMPRSPWSRLVAAARLAPADGRDAAAPVGFATRVAALALTGRGEVNASLAALIARFSWRALGVAALVMAVSAATNLQPLLASLSQHQDAATALTDPVGDWLNVS